MAVGDTAFKGIPSLSPAHAIQQTVGFLESKHAV